MMIFILRDRIPHHLVLAVVSIAGLVLSTSLNVLLWGFLFFGSYLIFYAAFSEKLKMYRFSQYGDFSYGIYFFGCPVQQCVVYYLKDSLNPAMLFFISYPITLMCAVISWHLVGKIFLALKKRKFFIERIPNLKLILVPFLDKNKGAFHEF